MSNFYIHNVVIHANRQVIIRFAGRVRVLPLILRENNIIVRVSGNQY